MGEASRDKNRVTTLLGVSSADMVTPVPVAVDPLTGRILVQAQGSGVDLWDRVGTVLSPINIGDDVDLGLGDLLATDGTFDGDVSATSLSAEYLAYQPLAAAPGTNDGLSYYDSGDDKFYFRQNGGWVTLAGGTTPPGGLDTCIQFNNAGVFGGSADLTWDGSTLAVAGNATLATSLTLGEAAGVTGSLLFTGTTSGVVTITTKDAAGTYTLTLPDNDGGASEFLQTDGSGNLSWAAAPVPSAITVADEATDTSCFLLFATAATGDLEPKSNAGLTFDSSTGILTATGFSGNLTGDVTGNCSGTSANVTGTVAIANGGTGETSATNAINALLPAQGAGTTGQFLKSDGSVCSWDTVTVATPTLQAVFDAGQAIVIADTDNQTLALTNNDTTNNQDTFDITNATTGMGVYINQTGVLGSGKHALSLYSNVAQVTDSLFKIHSDNASSTAKVFEIVNDGTGGAIYIEQNGVSTSLNSPIYVYSNAQQTQPLVYLNQDNALSSGNPIFITNDGTGAGVYITKNNTGEGVYIDDQDTGANGNGMTISYQSLGNAFKIIDSSSTDNASIFIDKGCSGQALYIDQDYNSGIATAAFLLEVTNPGVGGAIGEQITLSSGGDSIGVRFNLDGATDRAYAFEFLGEEHDTSAHGGTAAGRIKVLDGGSVRYIYMYSD